MRIFFSILLLGFALNVNSADISDALHVYEEHFTGAEAGIHKAKKLVFLVARQPCIKQKQYAGTPEKKLATASVMGLFQEYVSQQELSIIREDVEFDGPFGDAIYTQMLTQSSRDASVYQSESIKIIDKGSGECERLLVYSLPEIPKKVRDDSAVKLIYQAALSSVWQKIFIENDLPLLEDWSQQGSFDALAKSIALSRKEQIDSETLTPIDTEKLVNDTSEMYRLSSDPHRVLYRVLTEQNPAALNTPDEYRRLALSLFQQANQLFDKGQTPKIIYRKLSLSLNLMPNQADAWDLLGALYRAFEQPKLSAVCHQQAIRLNPLSTESWLHLAKTMQVLKPETDLSHFYTALSQLPKGQVSPWGLQQITLWKKDQI